LSRVCFLAKEIGRKRECFVQNAATNCPTTRNSAAHAEIRSNKYRKFTEVFNFNQTNASEEGLAMRIERGNFEDGDYRKRQK
jgi:hypothetical protein